MLKECNRCKLMLSRDLFGVDNSRSDGLRLNCIECSKLRKCYDCKGYEEQEAFFREVRGGKKIISKICNKCAELKGCSQCSVEKPLTNKFFSKDAHTKTGFKPCCKMCANKNSKIYNMKKAAKKEEAPKKTGNPNPNLLINLCVEDLIKGIRGSLNVLEKCTDDTISLEDFTKMMTSSTQLTQKCSGVDACGKILPLTIEYFHRKGSKADGLRKKCIDCVSKYGKKYNAIKKLEKERLEIEEERLEQLKLALEKEKEEERLEQLELEKEKIQIVENVNVENTLAHWFTGFFKR